MKHQRVALITGAARGIGRGIVADLATDHDIALTYLGTDPAQVLADAPDALAIRADLTEPDAPEDVIAQVLKRFGRIDVLVNNAGLVANDSDINAVTDIMAVNMTAPIALFNAALPHLKPGSCVVNISSVNAVFPAMSAAAYSASKAALNTWTRAAAKIHGPKGIRVNAVAPGAIELPESPRPADLVAQFVDLTALGRVGQPDDIAKAVRFLSSEDASYITGEVLTVSGGYRL